MSIFEKFLGTREVPQRQAPEQNVKATTPTDHYWGVRVPDTPVVSDTRDPRNGYTGAPLVSGHNLAYGQTIVGGRDISSTQQGSTAATEPSQAGSVPAGWQSGSDGRVRQ